MASIFSLYGEIFVDNEKATKGIEDTKTKAEKAKESFQNLSKSCMDLSKKMTLGFTAGVAAITGIVESTKEYRNTMNGLETSFKTAGLEANDATNTYKSLYSVLGDTGKAKEAAQFIGLMAKNEKDLATWTDICTGVYATFGDALPIEGLTEAANETVKVGQVTGVLADALNWVGISEDEFNEKLSACSDEQEREQLIRETLNDTYKEASDIYKETNESIIQNNESQANLTENLSNIAEIFEPLVTKGKELLNSVLIGLQPVLTFFVNNLNILGPLLISLWATITGFGLIGKIETFKTTLSSAFTLISSNPIVLVIGAIVAALTLLITNWDTVKEGFVSGLEYIGEKIEVFKTKVVEIVTKIKDFFVNAFNGIKNTFKNTIDSIVSSCKNVINIFKNIIDFIKNVFTGNWKGAWENIKNIFKNIVDGFGNIFKVPINFIIDLINGFISGLNKIQVPDWVPLVGGKGINIPLIKKLKVGIDYVPYDEMPAILHKGEQVLTAEEAQEYKSNKYDKKQDNNYIYNNNIVIEKLEVREDKDIKRIAEELYYLQQKREV